MIFNIIHANKHCNYNGMLVIHDRNKTIDKCNKRERNIFGNSVLR